MVHNRESDAEMLCLVREPEHAALRADFHSFSGSAAMAQELIRRGFYFGFSGMVTFRQADNIRELLALVPEDRLLLETDTPYLAPVPHRGKPSRPAHVALVAARIAAERGWTPAETAQCTTANFHRLFPRAGR